ncbi:MAG: gliding motility-associated C-terminal domain-containing protein [Bacteroidetes bacterium]|nr:gliding motility-associated C-terminal domain-containing protein [Bacteroidota bacterium]
MKHLLPILAALLFSLAACKKDESADTIRFCPNIYAQYSYENNGDTAYCFVPNVFSANGDGNNDAFQIGQYNIDSASITIKDGNTVVYQTDTMWASWYGHVNGEVSYKVFDYTVSGVDIYGNAFNLTGTVSVLSGDGDINFQWMNGTVNCDSCRYGSQWDGMKYNPTLPTNEFMVDDCEEF